MPTPNPTKLAAASAESAGGDAARPHDAILEAQRRRGAAARRGPRRPGRDRGRGRRAWAGGGRHPAPAAAFEQDENATTRAAGGAGLGLAIVKLLTGAMGGRLRLVTEPGRGLRAVVSLPTG